MLMNKVELLQTNDENLFGKEFSDHLTESVKSKKSSKEVFLKLDDSKKPFRSGPSFQQQQRKSRGKNKLLRIIEAIELNKTGAGAGKMRVFKAVAGDFKVTASPTQLLLDTSPVIPNVELANVYPLIKRLFSKDMLTKAVNILPAGRMSHFLVNWQKLTLNQDILSVVKGYKIPFIKIPFQRKIPNFTKMNKKQIALVDLELKEMLRKGAIMRTQPTQGEFLSNLFLMGKKDEGYRPVINLKMLN